MRTKGTINRRQGVKRLHYLRPVVLRLLLVTIAYCLTTTYVSAQDFIEDFKKINAKYKDSSYHMKLSYNYYNELSSAKPDEVLQGEVRKQGQKYYVKMHKMETIISGGIFLQVNHDLKALILDSNRASYSSPLGVPLDSLQKFYKGAKYKEQDSVTSVYKIPSIGKGIAYTQIYFNKVNYEIERIAIHFLDLRKTAAKGALRNKLIINYTQVDFTPTFNTKSFSQSKYIYKSNGTYKVSKAYKHYRLVNNIKI